MTARYPVWDGSGWSDVDVPTSGGEPIVVPNVTAIVHPPGDLSRLLLQRRDKPDEPVYRRLETPGGRWRAGESALEAVRREVAEETGLRVIAVSSESVRHEPTPQRPFVVDHPIAVTVGVEGAYPALLAVFVVEAEGDPVGLPGESFEPSFWDVTDVRDLLDSQPEAFTAAAHSVLRTYLG
ncbi:MAG: NUDIX domain-containing protein [Acidimicrobiia bacterium]|nr:NUDIX domain-containing protein [Acidimicrobiia bacterium]MBT8214040.1 NUDIX domain-containing protein [Acidimicrobiia bacterium]NNF68368.1 NUDIX domain-containing protein [Acidimicrobiia bacterium]NNK91889.1 NUDIX domain-containing protein [Acidimicrobiia bacterium]